MKILVCDNYKITSYHLPDKIEGFYIINYYDNYLTSESITLEAENGSWTISSDESFSIIAKEGKLKKAILKVYDNYKIKFGDSDYLISIQIMPDIDSYTEFSINSISTITIGSAESCNISYNNGNVFLNHCCINLKDEKYYINANDDNAYIYVNMRRIKETFLNFGDVIFINGLRIIWMNNYIKINNPRNVIKISGLNAIKINTSDSVNNYTPVTETERNIKLYKENQLFFHTPRFKSEIVNQVISIDSPPNKIENETMPIFFTIGSSAVFGLMACTSGVTAIIGLKNGTTDILNAVMELVICVLMLITSLLFPILSELWQKNNYKRKEKRRQKKYIEYLDKKKNKISDIIKEQERILKENNISLDLIIYNINNGKEIWNRDIFDNDFLLLSLGVGNIPANLTIQAPGESFELEDDILLDKVTEISNSKPILSNVPVNISILQNRVLPIIINTSFRDDFIKSIMLQLIYYYSGKDLKIVIFTNKENEEKWNYFRYLPHCWDNSYQRRFFAVDEDEMINISMFLEAEYDKRLSGDEYDKNDMVNSNDESMYLNFSKYYLIVTDDFKTAKDISIVNKIINGTKNIGFSLLIFESSIKNLPSRLNKFVDIENNLGGIYSRNLDKDMQIQFKTDYVEQIDICSLAQTISNIPLYSKDVSSSIPSSLTFLDMYQVGMVDQLGITSRWKENDPTVSLKAPIGIKDKNKLLDLDLHEKFHGPHGLIAGSTGSGKSEFIITYILSMAINYHPYEVQFILIDYKGGGLAGAFENRETGIKIPHLVGTITNLDTSEMNRTLVSISSELKRRQKIFNVTREKLNESTIDIYKYQRFYREGKVKEPMSHLFIISDEFAELKSQQPDFMDELISTARIGRSLGVHLILATQKPSGVVDDQIWSNTRFRICLKVQTVEDSVEMLKKDAAANIKETGRFYLQVGNDELFELGQSGWAGAKYNPVAKIVKKIDDDIVFVNNSGEVIKSINDELKKENSVDNGEQLTNIVNHLYNIALKEKITFSQLWLPSLANEIYYGNLIKKYQYKANKLLKNVVIGEYDNPSKQLQGLYEINLSESNTIIFGMPGSGKENLIITTIFSACISYSPYDIEFYILDFGAEILKLFKNMPHVGDIIDSEDNEKISALFLKLEKEIKKRKELFSNYEGNYISYCKNNNSDNKVPLIVVVLNAYESFMENTGSSYDDYLIHLLREGNKYGITFIVSAVATNSFRTNALDLFSNKILLQLQDSFDYVYMLGASSNLIPKKNFGRGLASIDEEACEFQTALVNYRDDINTYVKSVGNYLFDNYKYKVSEIKGMPKFVLFNDMKKYVNNIDNIPIGVIKDDASIYKYNFIKNKFNLITGNDIISNVSCFGGIIDLIDMIKSVKMFVVDFGDCINFDGNAIFYNSNFTELFDTIISVGPTNTDLTIYYMVGIGNVENVLSSDELDKFNIVMNNLDKINNSYFIIVDDYYRLNNLYKYDWYSDLDISNGIWVGTGISQQNIFNVDDLSSEDLNSSISDVAYVINDNECTVIKTISDGEEGE